MSNNTFIISSNKFQLLGHAHINSAIFETAHIILTLICFSPKINYSRTPLFRSPKGNGKKFEIAGFRNNRGKVNPRAFDLPSK